jgi:predicted RNase H-like HicB family nuclease
MDKYSRIIYWSDEDEAFIAEVPELSGCMTHGDTQAAAVANSEEAVQLWLDTAKEFGKAIPAPRGRSMDVAEFGELQKGGRSASPLSMRRKKRPAARDDILKARPITNPLSR